MAKSSTGLRDKRVRRLQKPKDLTNTIYSLLFGAIFEKLGYQKAGEWTWSRNYYPGTPEYNVYKEVAAICDPVQSFVPRDLMSGSMAPFMRGANEKGK